MPKAKKSKKVYLPKPFHLSHKPRRPTIDLGLIAGTELPILVLPRYKDRAKDLKFLRDVIRCFKRFPNDFGYCNRDSDVQVIQHNHAWHSVIRLIATTGGTCGKFERGSFKWIFYILACAGQTESREAERHWVQKAKIYPGFDIKPFYAQSSHPLPYVIDFIMFLIDEVKRCPPAVRVEVREKLFAGTDLDPALFEERFQTEDARLDLEMKTGVMGAEGVGKAVEDDDVLKLVGALAKVDLDAVEGAMEGEESEDEVLSGVSWSETDYGGDDDDDDMQIDG